MDDKDFEAKAKVLREKLGEKKKQETEDATKERMKKTLSSRDSAMRKIWSYQDETGIPTQEETETNFLNNEIGD